MSYKIYNINHEFIKKSKDYVVPKNFTGIIEDCNMSIKEWFQDGYYHRLDEPAVIWYDGTKEWWVYGEESTELECKLLVDIMKLKGLL